MHMENLPGGPKKIGCRFFTTPTEAIRIITGKGRRGACAANDNGSISVWRDNAGKLRAARTVYRSTRSEAQPTSLKALRAWLKRELPLIC